MTQICKNSMQIRRQPLVSSNSTAWRLYAITCIENQSGLTGEPHSTFYHGDAF